jgi:hypothetical protein
MYEPPKHWPPKHWLNHRTTVAAAEAASEAGAKEHNLTISPAWLARWNEFKAKLQVGDELWYFEHFPEPMTGAAGYCIVREGESVAHIATMRS